MTIPSLALVGFSTRAAAWSAARAGFDLVAIDLFGDLDQAPSVRSLSINHDLGGEFDVWRLVAVAREQRAAAVAYEAPFENHPEVVAALAAPYESDVPGLPELLGNPADVLAAVRDLDRLEPVVARAGATLPERLAPGQQPGAGEWLHKRRKSGGGLDIEPWPAAAPDDPEVVVQRRVEGTSCSTSFLANGSDTLLLAVTRQLNGDPNFHAPGFAYCGNLLLPDPAPDLLERLQRLATELTQEFRLRGLNGIDFILSEETIYVLEVNPRYSASMELIEEALDVPLFAWHAAGCRGEALPSLPQRTRREVPGKAIVYAWRDLTLGDTRGWPALGRRDVPHPGETIQMGHPLCTLVAWGDDDDSCHRALVSQAEALREELDHG